MDAPAPTPLFVLTQPTEFWWTVRIPTPAPDGNDYRFAALDLRFAPSTQAEIDRMQGLGLKDGEQPPTDDEIIQAKLRGWRKFNDVHGNPVPFTPENLALLLDVPMARSAIVATYLAAVRGIARKNA